MHQQQPRFDVAAMLDTVDSNRNLFFRNLVHWCVPFVDVYPNGLAAIKFFCRLLQVGLCSDTSTPALAADQEPAFMLIAWANLSGYRFARLCIVSRPLRAHPLPSSSTANPGSCRISYRRRSRYWPGKAVPGATRPFGCLGSRPVWR